MAASTRCRCGGGHRNQAAWPPYMARFEPLERLGAGINGEVFKAWDTKAGKIVAVKRRRATGDDGSIVSGLPEVLRECRSLRTCEDIPSMVKLREKVVPAVQSEGDSFVVMEYAGRINLRSYMQLRARLHRPFSEAEVQWIMKQLLEGVKAVHGKDIMHLNIKPENVILDDDSKEDSIFCSIGGFGMSWKKEQGPTQPEVMILTPYSAPELLLRSREYDERVDTWGLGCIMNELLSGTGTPTWGVRRQFPSGKLSSAGFDVLSGLLESNPAKRLTAAEALEKPWFQERPHRGFGGCFP